MHSSVWGSFAVVAGLWGAFSCADRAAFETRPQKVDDATSGASGMASQSDEPANGGGGAGGAGGAGNGEDIDRCPADASAPTVECAVYAKLGEAGSGTKDSPLGSVNEAIRLAIEGGRSHVFVCNGTYEETLTVSAGSHPLKIVGGFDCDSWETDDAGETLLAPSPGSHALEIDSHEVTLEDLAFEVPDAVEAGGSAIGGYVIDSHAAFVDVRVTVGKGAAGMDGVLKPFTLPNSAQLAGKSSTVTSAGAATEVVCPAGDTTRGGAGGGKVAEATVVNGEAGLPAIADADYPDSGRAGEGTEAPYCTPPTFGVSGADGSVGDNGAGASVVGSIVADRWVGASGVPGKPGSAGQGGGGAGGNKSGYAPGGGAGGCGGAGGPGGQAGGSSLGLVVIRSEVSLETSLIRTSDAGAAGDGGAGQSSLPHGGSAGTAYTNGSTIVGCEAGAGGRGGDGGGGGGGAGGSSVAVVSTADSTVVLVETETEQGLPGAQGEGPVSSLDGVAGVAQPTYVL